MKALLMYRDRDFDLERALPSHERALTQDLELDTLWSAMAADDKFVFEVAKRALLQSLRDPGDISYRQEVLADSLNHASVLRDLYELTGEALKAEKNLWGGLYRDSPRSLLGASVNKMEVLVEFLRRLRDLTDQHAASFHSPGFTRLFAVLAEELDDRYFELVEIQLKALKFKPGMLLSARLTTGNKGSAYTLRRAREQSLLGRVLDRSGYSFTIPDRDDNGFKALGEIEDRGVNLVANALAQSLDHVESFFTVLRTELAFYVGCLNLSDRLGGRGGATCAPEIGDAGELELAAAGIYDVCLALTLEAPVMTNDLVADDKSLVMITGANQGGKSTFLRSVGLAQLMAQCGMFVGASALRLNVCDGVFTHYKREEDEAMEGGKLDEELARMSEIADHITANCVLLCNESFASTNEREGSEIARQVIAAMLAETVKVLFVTHMYDLAAGCLEEHSQTALSLRAERETNGTRPFKLSEGRPLPTSYGEDSYRRVFGREIGPPAAADRALGPPDGRLPAR